MEKGYVQIYTGNGKGKTTAALGLGLRATGRGFKVLMVQFLKGTDSGEYENVKNLEGFKMVQIGESDKFTWKLKEAELEELRRKIQIEFNSITSELNWESIDILILDEVMAAITTGLIEVEEICKIIDNKLDKMEIILTGRNAPIELVDRADLITEMKAVRHYMEKGVKARIGIER